MSDRASVTLGRGRDCRGPLLEPGPIAAGSPALWHAGKKRGQPEAARVAPPIVRDAHRRRAPRTATSYFEKLALADRLAFICTEQTGAVPVQAPLQPTNVLPGGGVAVNATSVPGANSAVQLVPQLIA